MTQEPTDARKSFGDIAPHLAEITDKILFGDVWARPGPVSARPQPRHHHEPYFALSNQ